MSDADLRLLERQWREEGTIAAASTLVSARRREGVLGDEARLDLRSAAKTGVREPAERLFIDAWIRGDTGDARIALSALDGTPGTDQDARENQAGILQSGRQRPCALGWRRPKGTPGERYLAGWLATLAPAERIFLWSCDVLSEPAVMDEERRVISSRAVERLAANVDDLARSCAALIERSARSVCYSTGSYLEGGPPTIERATPRLTHGILRRALVLDLLEGEGRGAARAVLEAILERPESLEPSRPEIRLASAQIFPIWRSTTDDRHPMHERAIELAAREFRDSYILRGALGVIAALPELLGEEHIGAGLERLLRSSSDLEPVAYAFANHFGPALDRLPPRFARDLLANVERPEWDGAVAETLALALLVRGEALEEGLRKSVEKTLLAIAARGNAPETFAGFLGPALLPNTAWPSWRIPQDLTPVPPAGPGLWLRGLAPSLIRALAGSPSDWARIRVAEMWRGAGVDRFPPLADVWRRLAADADQGVRDVLRTGEINW
ncbi:MAG TPA: hypothetical protein VFF73_12955 [Planctomycetota bacterium]|nr:hypothetical protein [Planctomycetota bacterium]